MCPSHAASYLLSNLILLGAVYNKFRLGEPGSLGLIASPAHKSRVVRGPHEVIQAEKHRPSPPSGRSDAKQAGRETKLPLARRAGGYALVGLAVLTRLFRRRGSRTIKT